MKRPFPSRSALNQSGSRRKAFLGVSLMVGLTSFIACQSPLWLALEDTRLSEESRSIREAYAARGLIASRTDDQNFRCTTRYFDFDFPAAFAGTVLDLAVQADAAYERMAAWFRYGVATRRIPVRVNPLATYGNGRHDAGILNAGAVCEAPLPALMGSPQDAVTLDSPPNTDPGTNSRRAARHVFAHRVAHVFLNRHMASHLFQQRGWWFREGVAGYVASEDHADTAYARQILAEVAHAGGPLTLDGLPESLLHPAWRDYRAALSFFLFVHMQYGEDEVQRIDLSALHSPTVETAPAALSELEMEWRRTVDEARRHGSEE